MKVRSLILVPSIRRGNGMGHLFRCAGLVEKLPGALLWLPRAGEPGYFSFEEIAGVLKEKNLAERVFPGRDRPKNLPGTPEAPETPVFLLDLRETGPEDLALVPPGSFLLGLDEGGRYRKDLHYLIDTLPRLSGKNPPNAAALPFPEYPRRREAAGAPDAGAPKAGAGPVRKVLVTFGAEDPKDLGGLVLRRLLSPAGLKQKRRLFPESLEVTFLVPPGRRPTCLPSRRQDSKNAGTSPAAPENAPETLPGLTIKSIPPAPDLKDRLADYDLAVTSFGITAYEAAAAGTPALLVNPSGYHRRLARKAGFPCLGTRRFPPGAFYRHLLPAAGPAGELQIPQGSLLREILEEIRPEIPACPLREDRKQSNASSYTSLYTNQCVQRRRPKQPRRARRDPVIARFPGRTWYRCRSSGLLYQSLHKDQEISYGREYFFEEYRSQYGKTYLEDFPHLRKLAARRLDIIEKLSPRRPGSAGPGGAVLDLGCAYGAFLLEARDRGWEPLGADISPQAAGYVAGELGIPAVSLSAEDLDLSRDFGRQKAGLLVLWYVIEHLPDLGTILAKLAGWQDPGGLLAFSTPNYSGVSGRFFRRRFLEESPRDHYHVWNPRSARRIMKIYGYRVRKIRITGHHPERFPGASGAAGVGATAGPAGGKFRRLFFGAVSRIFRLGDTFEVYCERRKDR